MRGISKTAVFLFPASVLFSSLAFSNQPLPKNRKCYTEKEVAALSIWADKENRLAREKAVKELGFTLLERTDAFYIESEFPVGHQYDGKEGQRFLVVEVVSGSAPEGKKVKTWVASQAQKVFALADRSTSVATRVKTCNVVCRPGRGVQDGFRRVVIPLRNEESFGGIAEPMYQLRYLEFPVPAKKACPPAA